MNINKILKCNLLLLLTLCTFCFLITPPILSASTVYNTIVTDDLSKSDEFNIDDYTIDVNDYSLDVISIAEGSSKELFVYVYRPSNSTTYHAKKISMSNEEQISRAAVGQQLYDLELVSSYSVFDKYKVLNYTVSSEEIRIYNIVSIYRDFITKVDAVIGGTVTNYKSYSVGKQFYIEIINNEVNFNCVKFDTLAINVKLTSFLNFQNGITLGNLIGKYKIGQAHFIAFDVEDYIVEHIYDADLSFKKRTVTSVNDTSTYTDWVNTTLTLCDSDVVNIKTIGLGSNVYKWNRISNTQDFIDSLENQNVTFEESKYNDLIQSKWVFSFYENEVKTDIDQKYTSTGLPYFETTTITEEVEDIAILRIFFIDDTGKKYNLGVVGDITSNDGTSSGGNNPYKDLEDFFNNIKSIISLILGLVLLVVLIPILKIVLKILIYPFKIGIKYIKKKKKKNN